MSTEDRYRRLLGLLPAWYRERYGEEMVDVYLAGHPEPDARPGAGEVAATAGLAVTTRLQAVGRPSRATLWIVALVATTLLAAHALSGLWQVVWMALNTTTSWRLGADGRLVEQTVTFGAGYAFSYGLYELLWVGVLVALLVGARRAALVLGVPVAVLDVSAGLGPLVARDARSLPMDASLTDARAAVLPLVVIAALVVARGSAGAVPWVRDRLVAAGLTGATLVTIPFGFQLVAGDASVTPWTVVAMLSVALAAAAVVVLLLCRWLDPAWPAALLTLAVVALVAAPLPGGPAVMSPSEDPLVGAVAAAIAAVIGALAWFLTAGRHVPDHVIRASQRRQVAA